MCTARGAGAARGTMDAAMAGVVAGKGAAGSGQRDASRPLGGRVPCWNWASTRSGGLERSNGRDSCRKRPKRPKRAAIAGGVTGAQAQPSAARAGMARGRCTEKWRGWRWLRCCSWRVNGWRLKSRKGFPASFPEVGGVARVDRRVVDVGPRRALDAGGLGGTPPSRRPRLLPRPGWAWRLDPLVGPKGRGDRRAATALRRTTNEALPARYPAGVRSAQRWRTTEAPPRALPARVRRAGMVGRGGCRGRGACVAGGGRMERGGCGACVSRGLSPPAIAGVAPACRVCDCASAGAFPASYCERAAACRGG
jgi:hypothetical protein